MCEYQNGGGKREYVYMATSNDEYELPCAIASTQKELARKVGVSTTAITHALIRGTQYKARLLFYKVDITDV